MQHCDLTRAVVLYLFVECIHIFPDLCFSVMHYVFDGWFLVCLEDNLCVTQPIHDLCNPLGYILTVVSFSLDEDCPNSFTFTVMQDQYRKVVIVCSLVHEHVIH